MADDKESIQRLGKVFLDSYFIVDKDRKMVEMNQGFTQLLDARPSEKRRLANTPCYDSLRLEICQDRCIALECLKKNGPVRMSEIKGRAGDKDVVLELSAIPLKDDKGNVTGVFVTQRDITDERRLKTRFLENEELHQKERESLLQLVEERDAEIERMRHG